MLNKIRMPSGGQTTDELVIVKWYKAVGDNVKQGDILFEIETDKAILTVESYAEGTLLEINYQEGQLVRTGEVVAYIGLPGDWPVSTEESVPEKTMSLEERGSLPKNEEISNMPYPAKNSQLLNESETKQRGGKILASPLAKRLASSANISIDAVATHFSTKMVKKKEVEGYLAELERNKPGGYYFVEMTSARKAIAKHTLDSVQKVPHFFISVDVDMGACMLMRKKLNKLLEGKGISIAFHDILMKVVSKVISAFPLVNASYQDGKIKVNTEVNFGLAVAVEGGLLVPVVQETNRKPLPEIAKINAANIEKARTRKIEEHEISGGTITLSNLGMYGINGFTGIINQPESCILAVGGIIARAVVVNNEIVIRDIMNITGSFDHRIIDGALGAAFLQEVKTVLENPESLLL